MFRTTLTAFSILAATAALAGERARSHAVGGASRFDSSSEVRIDQVPAGASAPAKPITEGEAQNGPVRGSSAPITCNDQNASSPTCYTATQQGRPVTR